MNLYLHLFAVALGVGLWFPSIRPSAPAQLPRFDQTPCPVAIPSGVRVECGSLLVLEDRSRPDSPRLQLPVIIVKSRTAPALPDPIVFTAGGPGFSSFGNIAGFARAQYTEQRDLILFEQRGTRHAQPVLACDELDRALLENVTRAAPVQQEIEHEVAAAGKCRERLTQTGINVAAYHTASIAADLEDLRQVLGYTQWNLFGTSYSTRLMFTLMREYPSHIRSVVLDSPVPLTIKQYEVQWQALDRALQQTFARCGADPRCAAAYPRLEQQLSGLIERFNRAPLVVTVTHPLGHEPLHAMMTGDDLAFLVMGMLYDWQTIPYVPFLIDQLDRGNAEVATPLVQSGIRSFLSYQRGMYYSVQCHDQMPFNDRTVMSREQQAYPSVRNVQVPLYRSDASICDMWHAPSALRQTNTPITSTIPTLFVVGEYDPIVSPDWSDAAATTLDTSFVYKVPGMGHSPIIKSSCGQSLVAAFLDQPTRAPDDCTAALTGLPFTTPDQIHSTAALYNLNGAFVSQRTPLRLWLGWCFLLMVTAVIAMSWGMWSWRGRSTISRLTVVLAGLAASLHLVFVVGLVYMVQRVQMTDPIMLGFGLPAAVRPLLVLPAIASLLSVILLVLVVWRWVKLPWAMRARLFYTLTTLTLVGYASWLVWFDLLPANLAS